MVLKHTKEFLEKLQTMDLPISNTTHGEAIHQTTRNKITTQLKEALFKDCEENFSGENGMSIIPYLVKEGVVLDVPNSYIADNTDPNYCNGSISIVWDFTIKGLEYDGAESAREYQFKKEQDKQKAEKAEADKQAKIEKQKQIREERERKRARAIELAMMAGEDD